MAVAFETRMCSTRKAPTGMMPERECRRRSRKLCPWPARNGPTPGGMRCDSGGGLTVAAIWSPFEVRRSQSNLALSEVADGGVKKHPAHRFIDEHELVEDSGHAATQEHTTCILLHASSHVPRRSAPRDDRLLVWLVRG